MPDEQLPVVPAIEPVHVGYIPVFPLDRLMELRDALVALKGPLASNPQLQESVQKSLINAENHERVLGNISPGRERF
ncbi:type VI secretion system contractile sheath small subunit [Pseudomonas brenneri]